MARFTPLLALIAALLPGFVHAADKPVLNVYTYDSFVADWGPGPAVKTAFEGVCNCHLKFTTAGDGAALLARIQLEGTRTKADVVLGLDTNLVARATATGLFAAHGAQPVATDIPGGWSDPIFLAYDWGYFAFVYDKTKLSDAPTNFRALAALPDTFKIVIEDPRSSTPGLGLLLWVKMAYGDDAPAIWAGLKPHILTVTKGWSEAYGMFLNGEADMVLSYTTSPSYHLLAENDDTKAAAIFTEGNYMQIEVAAKLATAPNPGLADQFLAFMQSDAFQSIIPQTNWMFPAVKPSGGLPKGFAQPLPAQASLILPADAAFAIRKQALDEWLTALSN